eukprot:scaffold62683_cov57-Phaeocystis_antarctica.AAC.1
MPPCARRKRRFLAVSDRARKHAPNRANECRRRWTTTSDASRWRLAAPPRSSTIASFDGMGLDGGTRPPGRCCETLSAVLCSHAHTRGDLVLGGFDSPEEDGAARIAPLAVRIGGQAADGVLRAAEAPVGALAAAAVEAAADDEEHETGRVLGELARHVNQGGQGGHRRARRCAAQHPPARNWPILAERSYEGFDVSSSPM